MEKDITKIKLVLDSGDKFDSELNWKNA